LTGPRNTILPSHWFTPKTIDTYHQRPLLLEVVVQALFLILSIPRLVWMHNSNGVGQTEAVIPFIYQSIKSPLTSKHLLYRLLKTLCDNPRDLSSEPLKKETMELLSLKTPEVPEDNIDLPTD
jgi:hypothetical protein